MICRVCRIAADTMATYRDDARLGLENGADEDFIDSWLRARAKRCQSLHCKGPTRAGDPGCTCQCQDVALTPITEEK